MKINNITVAIIVLVLVLLSCRQFVYGQWELLNPKPTTTSLRSVCFVNKNVGYVGGDQGLLMKTTDGGISWERQILNTNERVYAISFIDASTGFVLTNEDHHGRTQDNWKTYLYKTTDGGKTWNILYYYIGKEKGWDDNSFTSMKVIDEDTIYLAGEANIAKTTDKGITWNTVFYNTYYLDVRDLFFIDNKNGYFCGNKYEYRNDTTFYKYVLGKTNDYGKSWTYTALPATSYLDDLYSIFFCDSSVGYSVGISGVFFKTIDGGTSWTQSNVNTVEDLTSVWFTDVNTGYITTSSGNLFKTTDGGQTWNNIDTGTNKSLNKMYFVDKDYGIFVGGSGTILRTTDAGNSIDKVSKSATNNSLYSLSFINSTTGFVCGVNGTVLKTSDEGNNWEDLSINTDADLMYIYFSDENNGVAYGRNFNSNTNFWDVNEFYITTIGGKKWKKLDFDSNEVNTVSFLKSKIGYAAGGKGKMLKTFDFGANWKAMKFDSAYTIWNLNFNNEAFGYGFYMEKYLILTTDSGKTWQFKHAYPIEDGSLQAVYFIDSINGFVTSSVVYGCSHNGYCVSIGIKKTSDGGNSWKEVFSQNGYVYTKSNSDLFGGSLIIKSIYFIDENRGYAIGYNHDYGDLILETKDKGETWQDISYGTNSSLYAMTFTQQGIGYAVGSEGAIFKFRETVSTNVSSVKSLKDGVNIYPNPADDVVNLNLTGTKNLAGEKLLRGLKGLEGFKSIIEIYNLTGIKILSQAIKSNNTAINVSKLADGMYIIKFFGKDMTEAKKLIVKH